MARTETILRGLSISGGVAYGHICLANDARHNALPVARTSGARPQEEWQRFTTAVRLAGAGLDRLITEVTATVGRPEAEIFMAQKAILEDPGIVTQIHRAIEEDGLIAERAITEVLESLEDRLSALDNAYIRERATDIGELKRRLLDVLGNTRPALACEGQDHCQRGHELVVCAEELTPSLTVELDTAHVLAFVTRRGGVNSHAGILARSLGIPAVSGIDQLFQHAACGVPILVDGDAGTVTVHPEHERVTALPRVRQGRDPARVMGPVAGVRVEANVGGSADLAQALAMRAEGIGLYRTEVACLAENRLLDEEEQYLLYRQAVEQMAGTPVTFRLFDFGSDKPLPGMVMPREPNPALGLRGMRLLTSFPDLLRDQARAVHRAAVHGPVRLLYPMIVDVEQFTAARRVIQQVVADLPEVDLAHGVMLEIPAACLLADALLAEADFASIGSNDLTQYLFAVDRDNHLVSADFLTDRPAFWNLIDVVVTAAARHGREICFCGEASRETGVLAKLLERGIRRLSVNPGGIAAIREAVTGIISPAV